MRWLRVKPRILRRRVEILSQKNLEKNAEPTGLEPATSAVTGQRSDQLS